jgi:hypothetical protein
MQLNSARLLNCIAMEAGRVKLSYLFLLGALLLLCHGEAAAQPGGDASRFSALETCNESYLEREYVFTGRVISIDEIPNPHNSGGPLWKAVVEVETSLKGQLNGEIELAIVKYPPTTDWQVKGKRFIFTADRISNGELNGLYSNKWSTPLDDLPADVAARALDDIRAVLRGVPQPRIVGTVREQSWGINFEPTAGRPFRGIVVVAENRDGQRFKARTDGEGRFQFDELPPGMYTVSPVLPKKMDMYDVGFMQQEGNKKYVRVDEGLCSRELHFVGQETGSIAGRIELGKVRRDAGEPLLYLYRVDPKSHKIDFEATRKIPSDVSVSENGSQTVFRFSFGHIPTGSYMLSVSNIDPADKSETFYYPWARKIDEAEAINVAADKPTEVLIKLPSAQ